MLIVVDILFDVYVIEVYSLFSYLKLFEYKVLRNYWLVS